MRKAALLVERDRMADLLEALDVYRPRPGKPDYRRWEWYFLEAAARTQQSAAEQLRFTVQINELSPGTNGSFSVAWSGDGRRLAALCMTGDVKILEAATGKEISTLRNAAADRNQQVMWYSGQIHFSPNGRQLAQSNWSGKVKIWDVDKGTMVKELIGGEKGVIWSSDGRRLWLGTKGKDVRLWNGANGKPEILPGRDDDVNAACWSPDGKRLAAASADGTVAHLECGNQYRRWKTASAGPVGAGGGVECQR